MVSNEKWYAKGWFFGYWFTHTHKICITGEGCEMLELNFQLCYTFFRNRHNGLKYLAWIL